MTHAEAVAANLAVAVVLLAVGARLIVWALSGEPGRVHHNEHQDQEQPPA
ncbi:MULTISPECIES: hypothetical protein [Streptomyces]|nr:hypothetical protein [Streptomyces sp. FR-008]KAF0795857.1 hypothetical protein P405_00415 [Streptomyces sp. FR-008]